MKIDGWKEKLYDEIAKSSLIEFKWGETDCVKWSINTLRMITDNPLPFGVNWNNKKEALELLKEKSLKNRIVEYLGNPKPVTYMNIGDLVIRDDPELGETLGICIGRDCAFISKRGLTYYPLLDCKYCWSVD